MSFFKQYWNTVLEQAADDGCAPSAVRLDIDTLEKDTLVVDSVESVVDVETLDLRNDIVAELMPEEFFTWVDQVRGLLRPVEKTNTPTEEEKAETIHPSQQSVYTRPPQILELNVSKVYANGIEIEWPPQSQS